MKKIQTTALAIGLAIAAATSANSAVIGALGATINSGGPGFGSIEDTINQSGLSNTYTSGVTDFDSFTASTIHDFAFAGQEWFSTQGQTSATVTYDLGAANTVDKVALWNEDASGIGSLDLSVSTNGSTFTSLLSNLMPTDHAVSVDYGADIFTFVATTFQYIRFEMSGCPQPDSIFEACAIGEVAFNSVGVSPVPVPAGLPLLLGGLGLFGYLRRKQS